MEVRSGSSATRCPHLNVNVDHLETALAGEFQSAQLFIGDEYRVATSSEAGHRWDKNLTGLQSRRGQRIIGLIRAEVA